MTEFTITLPRDWDQVAEHIPVAQATFKEYDEPDDQGFVGEIRFDLQVNSHTLRSYCHRMRKDQFRFFVEQIAERYHAGGPK